MRCLLCEKLSLRGVCKDCLAKLLVQDRKLRVLENNLKVYSFFSYESISPIIHAKHHFWGHRILKQIAGATFAQFAKEFKFDSLVYAIGVDDKASGDYSHTAILTHALKSPSIKPLYGVLRARSKVTYSGKNFAYREANPRDFIVKTKGGFDAILVDDLITSGNTLKEASGALRRNNINPLFALTLADAKG